MTKGISNEFQESKISKAKQYDAYWKNRIEENRIRYNLRHQLISKLAKKYLQPGKKILDIGCGEGHLISSLNKFFNIYACDISKEALSLIKSKRVNLIQCDIDQHSLPFKSEFDCIICSMILHHLSNPQMLIDSFKQSLKCDGILIVAIPNTARLKHRISMLRDRFPKDYSPSHINYQTPRDVLEALIDKTFKLLEIKPVNWDRNRILSNLFPFLFAEQIIFALKREH